MIKPIVALDAPRFVHYGQIYLLSPGCEPVLPEEAFAGHRNGLCGGGVKGGLFLVTGLHTGYVQMRIEIHAMEPPVEDAWEEIVEASCAFEKTPVVLEDWGGGNPCELPLVEGGYRARYCAMRFGDAPEGNGEDGEELVERYALLLWPSPHRADKVLKQTSAGAAYWNNGAWTKKD